jgi:hypothetical protein
VPVKAVIECRDVDHSIYELPLVLQKEGMDQLVLDLFGLKNPPPAKNVWKEIVGRILNPRHEVTIGVVGKYIELQDAYKSVYESITHAGIANNCKVNIRRIDAEDVEKKGGLALLKGLDGILVPGGFGDRVASDSCGALFLWSSRIRSQVDEPFTGTIRGTAVHDASGRRISGVRITLMPSGIRAITDQDGNFVLPDLVPGDYEVVAEVPGAQSWTGTVRVSAYGVVTVELRM